MSSDDDLVVTPCNRARVDITAHRNAFREVTRQHDRLLLLLVNPDASSQEVGEQLATLASAVAAYAGVVGTPSEDGGQPERPSSGQRSRSGVDGTQR